jgi:hypothetical protein
VVELWDKISAETKRMADKMADKMVVRANKKPVFWVLIGLFMAFILALPASISSSTVMNYYNQFSENGYVNYKAGSWFPWSSSTEVDDSTTNCSSPLKVYMYELPRKYNIGMLKKGDTNQEIPWTNHVVPSWKQKYEVNKQHGVEYWMMVYLLDGWDRKDGGKSAIRVKDPEDADLFFVPFFSALSFNSHGGMLGPGDKQLQVRSHCFLV